MVGLKLWTIQNQVLVQISNGFEQNGGHESGFQMVGLSDFRSHWISRPFATQPVLDHSDPHCMRIPSEIVKINNSRVKERGGPPGIADAPGTSNSVHILVDALGEIEIHDVFHAADVETSSGDVCGHED